MAAASRDLQGLLAGLDPSADVARRHIWLIDLFDWLRGDRASPQAAMGRVLLLLDAIEARPELRERVRAWWRAFTRDVDLSTLLADYGFAPRTAFPLERLPQGGRAGEHGGLQAWLGKHKGLQA